MHKIVHIGPDSVHVFRFMEFLDQHFDCGRHRFFVLSKNDRKAGESSCEVRHINYRSLSDGLNIAGIAALIVAINRAEKIILHGLNEAITILLLFLMPWNLGKCYWFSWGSDIYKYQAEKTSFKLRMLFPVKKFVVRRIGHIVAALKGEYDNICKWFEAQGEWIACFKYPSNLLTDLPSVTSERGEMITVLIGNSADPSNLHEEAIAMMSRISNEHVGRIYCPLSYGGDEEYVNRIARKGKSQLGDRFVPLTEFLPLEKYREILSSVDIAIFNHRRQQAMGNIITLLGNGKKVFVRREISSWDFFQKIGVAIFPVDKLNLAPVDQRLMQKNRQIIREYFSEQRLKQELQNIFLNPVPDANDSI